MSEGTKEPPGKDFVVERTSADKLTDAEMAQCVAIVRAGKAIRKGYETQGLKETAVLAVVRQGGEIVAVGAIKKPRGYTATIAGKAEYDLPVDTPELGYIAVDKAHGGNNLSPRIVASLLDGHRGALFATTGHPKIKDVLKAAGFEVKGIEYPGEGGGQLSLWVKS
jgi:hypothetical protein